MLGRIGQTAALGVMIFLLQSASVSAAVAAPAASSTFLIGLLVAGCLLAVCAGAALLYRWSSKLRKHSGSSRQSDPSAVEWFPFGVYRVLIRQSGGAEFEMISDRSLKLLGVSREEASLADGRVFQHAHKDDREALVYAEREARRRARGFCHECRFVIEGEQRWLRLEARPTRGELGQTWDGCIVDVTHRQSMMEELKKSERRFRRVLQDVDGVAVQGYRPGGSVTYWNRASERLYGYSAAEAKQGNLLDLIIPPEIRDDVRANMAGLAKGRPIPNGEIELMRKDGSRVSVYSSHTALESSSGEIELFCIDVDLTDQKANERALERIANYDVLTGLPNRRLMADLLRQMRDRFQGSRGGFALCYLDLDDFKQINDRHGHDTGDQMLVAVADRLQRLLQGRDLVGRLGGDEFLVALEGLTDEHQLTSRLDAILDEIAKPVELGDLRLRVHCSIGVTMFPQDAADPDTLLRHADHAMYRAKSKGRNRYSLFDIDLETETQRRQQLLQEIKHGLDNEQFHLLYQPKIALEESDLAGFEGLIRWVHPDRGLIEPSEFLHWLDDTDLERQFGDYILHRALEDMETWQAEGMEFAVSVNISGPHLLSEGFIESLRALLADHSPRCADLLWLEILETAAVSDLDRAVAVLDKIHALGVKVSLDDFGTGFSSLSHLRNLPVDEVKIDRRFVGDMLTDPSANQIVRSIIGLADAFGLQATAEGVETQTQLKELRLQGCDFGQGYFFSRPMPAREVRPWVAAFTPPSSRD